ncbi:MAG TPA: thioredoxin family protein [Balneola sp.]|nr:thioredoxin family protein [Bacteroidota bacterium]HCT54504.1 thioredoxin family protein [Balneola sp.]|tara:strand:- start:111 stop:719 length:609 start_codon:yes stop_codon:yes gene_type:complete
MKALKVISVCILISFVVTEVSAQQSLSIGSETPLTDHKVEDVNGRTINLSEIAQQNGLVVIFSCNTCPMVSRWEDRMKALANSARLNNIGLIVLNPNERIRERGESLEDMKRRSTKQTYNFVYALDKDHVIADAFGATKTPEVFVFDGSMKLVYKGSIDDNPNNPSGVTKRYVDDAVQALASGNQVEVSRSVPKGCPIKRNE